MIHLISRTWKRSNRSEKIEGILKVLNRSGTAEAKYFKGRSNVISYYLWKEKPQPVNEDDEWNYVRITYQEKVALELLELRVHPADVGKVVGRQGRTARAIRTILSAAGMQTRKRYVLELLER